MDGGLAFTPARELVAALQRGELSSRELLDDTLARIEARDAEINAVVALDAERARADATAADEAHAAGRSLGPLHGLVMTVKDAFETEGLVTTSGAPELAGHVPDRDADAVARLRAAGAVIVGKTNLPLYAGDIQTFNDVYGRTNNPWATDRVAGGSSGGSAAALAAGMVPLELGSDIGGSIRNPAHFCGVTGMKPTFDLVSVRGHIPGPPGTLTRPDVGVAGPMARTVDDLELALGVLAGPVGPAASAFRLELPPARATDLAELRLATWLDDPAGAVAADTPAVLRSAVDRLADAGAKPSEPDRPTSFRRLAELFEEVVWGMIGAASIPEELWPSILELAAAPLAPGEPSLTRSTRHAAVSMRAHLFREEELARIRAAWDSFFAEHDVLLAPVVRRAAFEHVEGGTDPVSTLTRTVEVDGVATPTIDLTHWCGVFGVLHVPVVVVPAGRTAEGLPVGVQVVGGRYQDRTVLAAARAIEQALGPIGPPPAFA
jgi:amidase